MRINDRKIDKIESLWMRWEKRLISDNVAGFFLFFEKEKINIK